jgi:hypothetical protein
MPSAAINFDICQGSETRLVGSNIRIDKPLVVLQIFKNKEKLKEWAKSYVV